MMTCSTCKTEPVYRPGRCKACNKAYLAGWRAQRQQRQRKPRTWKPTRPVEISPAALEALAAVDSEAAVKVARVNRQLESRETSPLKATDGGRK